MEPFHLITQLEGSLKAAIMLVPDQQQETIWQLKVNLFYEDGPAGQTSFTLHGYDQAEAEEVARNLRSNAYLMREIDEYLWGESD